MLISSTNSHKKAGTYDSELLFLLKRGTKQKRGNGFVRFGLDA